MAGQGGALVPLSNGQTCIKTSAPQLPIARKYQDQGALPATGSTKQGFGAGVVQSRVFTTNSMEQRRSTTLPFHPACAFLEAELFAAGCIPLGR